MLRFFGHFAEDESGATAIEYGIIALFIAVPLIFLMTSIGAEVQVPFQKVDLGLKAGNNK